MTDSVKTMEEVDIERRRTFYPSIPLALGIVGALLLLKAIVDYFPNHF